MKRVRVGRLAPGKDAAAQAPSNPALQLRKMAELLGPCVKFSTNAPPPPQPGTA